VRSIFDHRQPVTRGNVEDLGHGAGIAAVVNHDDGPGAGRDLPFDVLRRNVQVAGTGDVGEAHPGIRVQHGIRGGDERQRGDDHLVSRSDPERQARQVERLGRVGDGQRVPGAGKPGKRGLELLGHRTHRQPAAPDHIEHGCLFIRAVIQVCQRNSPLHSALISSCVAHG